MSLKELIAFLSARVFIDALYVLLNVERSLVKLFPQCITIEPTDTKHRHDKEVALLGVIGSLAVLAIHDQHSAGDVSFDSN